MTDLTNENLILEWLEMKEHNAGRAVGTVNKYGAYLTKLAGWLAEQGKTLLQADRSSLESFTGIDAHKRGIAPRSRRPWIAAIRGFYHWAESQWYIQENPAKDLDYPSTGTRLPRAMSLANLERLIMQPGLEEFIDVRDTAIISVLSGCGLRVGGLVNMTQEDLLFADLDGKERMIIRVTEKGDKQRLVPVPDDTEYLIRAYLGHPDLKALDRTLEDGRQVLWVSMHNNSVPAHQFYGENTRLSENSVYRMIQRRGERAGIPPDQCHPHALRHTYGTELTEGDVQQRKIQVLLGHADIKSTAVYQGVAVRSLIKAVDDANPLSKITTPVTELKKRLKKGA
jgi:site-specific recombinase XerD